MSNSQIEELFAFQCKAIGLNPEREYKFHPVRKWRFDFSFPSKKIAIEIEGAIWMNGRHSRGSGMTKDMEKYNQAAKDGWFVFRFDGGMVKRGEAIKFIEEVLSSFQSLRS